MTLIYKIKFFDYWHLSSGLSAGSKLDSTVVKDGNNIPYVPGKTIKGLVREMALNFDCNFIDVCFGTTTDKKDKYYDKSKKEKGGQCYFSNAMLKEDTKKQIIQNNLQDNLYDVIASTKIGKESIAVDNSLRAIEVVVPLTLYGEIQDIPTKFKNEIKQSLKLIKRVGLNRNRGLGRCQFIVEVKS